MSIKSAAVLKSYFETGDRPTALQFADLIDSINTPFIGEIKLVSFSRIPVGWTRCDGRLLKISEHPILFELIGTNYGGDGVSTFAVPSLANNHIIALNGITPNLLPDTDANNMANAYDLGSLTTTEIYEEEDDDGYNEFRFRLLDQQQEIVLSSNKRYASKSLAFEALKNVVDQYINAPNSIQIKKSKNGKWFYNIVDTSSKILARRIEYFETEQACKDEALRVKEILNNN